MSVAPQLSRLGPIEDSGLSSNGPVLAALVARQHGIISNRQAVAAGVPRHVIRWRVANRRWQLVHPGVYCVYSGPLTREALMWAALLHAGSGAVLDGPTAATLHGLRRHEDHARIHIRVRHSRHPEQRPGIVIRRTRHLEPNSWVERKGFPAIRIERAVFTIAATRIGAISDAVQQGLTTGEKLRGVLLALGPIRGSARMMAAVRDVEGGSRSELEREFLRIVRRRALPLPERNYKIRVEGRRVYLDACCPEKRVYIEIDGKAFHVMTEDWEHDLDRQNAIVIEGWHPLRFSASVIRWNQERVVHQVRRALGL